jgi:hypothetical protein
MVSASQVFYVLIQLSSSTGTDLGRLRGYLSKINEYLSKRPSIFGRKNEEGEEDEEKGRKMKREMSPLFIH